jgi:hypothetical protein
VQWVHVFLVFLQDDRTAGRCTILSLTITHVRRWPRPTVVHHAPYIMEYTYGCTSIWIYDVYVSSILDALAIVYSSRSERRGTKLIIVIITHIHVNNMYVTSRPYKHRRPCNYNTIITIIHRVRYTSAQLCTVRSYEYIYCVWRDWDLWSNGISPTGAHSYYYRRTRDVRIIIILLRSVVTS